MYELKVYLVIALMGTAAAFGDGHQPFEIKPLDAQWKAEYDGIEGSTLEEKNQNAFTTWEMKSVTAVERWNAEAALAESANKLFQSLDNEGKELLLKTHAAWRTYIELQAQLVTDPCRGGSARGLYSASIIQTEMKIRTKLYEELLSGRSPCITGLSMYE